MNFKNQIKQKIMTCGNSICLGIDPHFNALPLFMSKYLQKNGEISLLEKFSEALISAGRDQLPAVKFQMAFYECYGWAGFKVLEESIAKAKSAGLLVILDGKRGDISSTMQSYGRMAFDRMGADCLTVTPYMGSDVIKPLIPWLKNGKGIYLVWVTSNPSGRLIQEYRISDEKISAEYLLDALDLELAQLTGWKDEELNASVGVVLGATKFGDLSEKLIKKISHRPVLLPGVGPQGGVVSRGLKEMMNTHIHLLPMSRGLAGLGNKADFEQLSQLSGWDDYVDFVKARIQSVQF